MAKYQRNAVKKQDELAQRPTVKSPKWRNKVAELSCMVKEAGAVHCTARGVFSNGVALVRY
jgi:hypothetical protein